MFQIRIAQGCHTTPSGFLLALAVITSAGVVGLPGHRLYRWHSLDGVNAADYAIIDRSYQLHGSPEAGAMVALHTASFGQSYITALQSLTEQWVPYVPGAGLRRAPVRPAEDTGGRLRPRWNGQHARGREHADEE